jgi:hypothetical protein
VNPLTQRAGTSAGSPNRRTMTTGEQPQGPEAAARPHRTDRDPFSAPMRKLGAATGLLFVVFLILSIVFGDAESPDFAAPAAEYEAFARENGDGLKVSLLMSMFAAFFLLWFSGVLRGALGQIETRARGFTRLSHVAFAGGIVMAIALVSSASIRASAANQPDDAGGEVIRAMVHVADAFGGLIPVGLAALLIAASLLMVATRAFPRWLGILGLVAGGIYVLLFFYALFIDDDDAALGFLWPVGFLGLLIWTVSTSASLLRQVDAERAPDRTLAGREPGAP